MVLLVISTAHAFPDGSGRTAVGVADVLMRKFLNKKINMKALEEVDEKLRVILINGSLVMLPDPYNPNYALNRGIERVIIPSTKTHSPDEVRRFTGQYAESVLSHMREFMTSSAPIKATGPYSLMEDSINPLADLLENFSLEI